MNGADGHFDLIKFKRDLYFKGGQKLMTEGDFASAQIYFMKILQIIFDIQAQFQLARCQQMLQEFQTALQTYEEVFQKNMKDPRPVYQQAYIYDVNLKQSELALTHYEKAANILTSTLAAAATASQFKEDPKYSIIFYTLGCKYEQRRQEDKAKRAFQQFLDFPAPISEKDRIRVNKKLIALSSRLLEDSETFNYKKSKQNQEANSQAQSQSKQLMQGSQLSPKHIQSIPRQQSFIKQGNNNEDEKSRSLQLRMQSQPSQLQQNQYENLGNSQPYLDVKDEISQKKEVRKPGDSNISSQQSTAEVKIPSIRPSNLFNAGQLEEQSLNSRAQHVQQQDFRFISAQNQQHLPPNLNQQHQQSQQYQQQQHQQQSQINQSQQQQYQQQQQQSSPQIILNGSEIKYNNNQSLINQQSQQQLSQQQIQQQQQQLPQGGYRSSESTIKYNQNSNQNISAQQIQQNTLQRHQNSTIKLNEFNSQEQMDAYFKRITFDANGPGSMWNSPFSHDDHNIDLIDKYEEVKHHFYPPYEEDYEEIFDDDIPDEKDGKMMQNKTSFNNTHTIKNIPMKSFIELTSSKQQNPSAISGVSHLSLSRFSYINYDQGSMISNNRQQQKDFEHPEKSMSAYMLDKQLGEGSYGKVYEVIYKADGNSFALKLIPNKEIHRQQLTNGEIDVMKILNHKNIIKIYNAFKSDDQQSYCIISELADNGTLKDYIKKKKGNVDKYEVLNLMKQMITALNYIHSQRIIHRDIKPSNIFLHGNSKQIKIGDFGIAKKLQNREIQQDVHSVGTEKYFSPEYRNEGFSEKSDIWSMGIVFLELLGVQVNGELNEQMKREHLKQIPPEMSEIIAGMTQTDPTMRSNSTKVINQLKVIK